MARPSRLARLQLVRREPTDPLAITTAVAKLEKDIGGRGALIEHLSAGDSVPEVEAVLLVIADPANDSRGLSAICRDHGISPGQLFDAVKLAATARGTVLAALKAAEHLPAITEDFLTKAVDHEEPCKACQGLGQRTPNPTKKSPNPMPKPCYACNGKGTIAVTADFDRQIKAFELVGLLKPTGGISINQQQNTILPATPTGSLAQLQQLVQDGMYQSLTLPAQPSGETGESSVLVPDGQVVEVTDEANNE